MGHKEALLFAPIALAAAGCTQTLADRPCPCGDGWSCSPASNHCVEGPATQIVDDMQSLQADGDGGINGYWYTYSDRTVANSSPVEPVTDAGFVLPMEGSEFDTSTDESSPLVNRMAQPYRRVDAGGEDDWGVGFGMDFIIAMPDGGPIPVNECGHGQVFVTGNIPQPFDASGWTGIQFYARSFGVDPVQIEVHIDDDRTSPWGQVPLDAGGCNACFSSGSDASACSDSFSNYGPRNKKNPITFPTADWTLIRVPFAELQSDNWANILQPSDPIHTGKIYNLHFQASTTPGTPISPFSVGVAYISFYKS